MDHFGLVETRLTVDKAQVFINIPTHMHNLLVNLEEGIVKQIGEAPMLTRDWDQVGDEPETRLEIDLAVSLAHG